MKNITILSCPFALCLTFGMPLPLHARPVRDLVTIVRDGGLTPSGAFHSVTRIETDGALLYRDNTSQKKAHLAPAELRLLGRELKVAHFPPPPSGEDVSAHRSAYDGQDEVVTLTTPHGRETVTDPEIGADANAPLLKTLQRLEAKYLR